MQFQQILVSLEDYFSRAFSWGFAWAESFTPGFQMFLVTVFGSETETWKLTFWVLLCVTCSMIAVPGAFCPVPFTVLGIVSGTFSLASREVAPCFMSWLFAYIWVGSGLLQKIQSEFFVKCSNGPWLFFWGLKQSKNETANNLEETLVNDWSVYSQRWIFRKTNFH